MNCIEFRKRIQSMLDKRIYSDLPEDLHQHAATCAFCSSYVEEMITLSKKLSTLPYEPIPQELLDRLHTIPARTLIGKNRSNWKFEIKKYSVWLVVGLILSVFSSLTNGMLGVVTNVIVLIPLYTYLFIHLLKRMILDVY